MSDQFGVSEGLPLLGLTVGGNATQLKPVGFHAVEAISAPFEVRVELVSTEAAIDADSLLYKPACLSVIRQNSGTRWFHGIVNSFSATGTPVRGRWSYTATIVPRMWFMKQTTDCRVFQTMSVADILQARCAEVNQTVNVLASNKTQREYLTQYNENDFRFVQRLLEQEGYFYFFVHSASDHVLTICDANQTFPASPKPSLHVVHKGGTVSTLTDWRKVRETTHGSVTVEDYDPTTPSTPPSGNSKTVLGTAGAPARDVFRWPARHFSSGQAADRAKYEMEAAEAAVTLHQAAGENHLFAPGSRFTLARDPFDGSTNVDYVVQSISHFGRDDSWVTTSAPTADYNNAIVAFPYATNWREPIRTEKPLIPGIHGAIVLGGEGEEIHADQYGRIKVQLFFDHRQDTTAAKGVWARVIQPWAGNTWGWQHLPRVGTEVAVSFMDGDPDRPVVVGGLYNGNMMPVFPIPAEQTKSGLRTRSTTQGGASTFSELSFDDKKGSELVYVHAERDMTREVEHDDKLTVENNRAHTVKQKETIDIGDTETITIKNDRATTISSGNDSLTVSTGNLSIKVNSGAVTIDAMQSITLTVGASSIKLDQMGVTIKGTMLQTDGSAMATHKGGIVMIN